MTSACSCTADFVYVQVAKSSRSGHHLRQQLKSVFIFVRDINKTVKAQAVESAKAEERLLNMDFVTAKTNELSNRRERSEVCWRLTALFIRYTWVGPPLFFRAALNLCGIASTRSWRHPSHMLVCNDTAAKCFTHFLCERKVAGSILAGDTNLFACASRRASSIKLPNHKMWHHPL